MKVFISWSGSTSKAVAEALREWLPCVIQAVEPWMSASDVEQGTRWFSEIAGQLKETDVGIICLTPANLSSPWLHFEAGAISKSVEQSRVCPYLFRVQKTDLKPPLSQFQVATADKDDTKRVLDTINNALKERGIPEKQLSSIFEKWWPDLEAALGKIPRDETDKSPKRSPDEILAEILDLVRGIVRTQEPTYKLIGLTGESKIGQSLRNWAVHRGITDILDQELAKTWAIGGSPTIADVISEISKDAAGQTEKAKKLERARATGAEEPGAKEGRAEQGPKRK